MKKTMALSLPAIMLAAFGYLKARGEIVPPSAGPLTFRIARTEVVRLKANEINREYDTKVKVVLQHYGSTPKWWPGNSVRPLAIGDTQLVTATGKIYRTTTGLPGKGLGLYNQLSYSYDRTKRQDTLVIYIRTDFLSSAQGPLTFKTKLSYRGKAQQVSVCVRGCA